MELIRAEAASVADALDNLSAAMFLVDACGQIVHANAAGQEMLYATDFLASLDGRLAARDPLIDQALREGCAAAGAGDSAMGVRTIALPLTAHDGERYLAHVLPLTSGARRTFGATYSATAAVFVRKVAVGSAADVIAQTYKLTPTELRVLNAIVEIGGVPETAQALGIAETTVKTHLYRLFDKTEASRQVDLVKLVAGYSNPLLGKSHAGL
jgi:DNA-binding CsgD family transcriptional regulator